MIQLGAGQQVTNTKIVYKVLNAKQGEAGTIFQIFAMKQQRHCTLTCYKLTKHYHNIKDAIVKEVIDKEVIVMHTIIAINQWKNEHQIPYCLQANHDTVNLSH